jgi:hypothetical protein
MKQLLNRIVLLENKNGTTAQWLNGAMELVQ